MRSSLHWEHILLVFLIYPVQYLVLDKQIGVLGLKQIVAFDFALEILTELLVSENQLLDGGVLLPKVDVTLLIAVDYTLELGNLDP